MRLNNLGQNHLETVLETVNEVSNSKIDSSELSEEEENKENNDNKKNEESLKIKEESGNITTENKGTRTGTGTGTDTKINDSDCNVGIKKSLYFLSSEKTH